MGVNLQNYSCQVYPFNSKKNMPVNFLFLPFLSFRIPVEIDNSIDVTIDKLLMKTLNGSTPTFKGGVSSFRWHFLKERKMKIGNFTKLLKVILFHYSFFECEDMMLIWHLRFPMLKNANAYTLFNIHLLSKCSKLWHWQVMLDSYERYLQLNSWNQATSCGHFSNSDCLANTTLQHPTVMSLSFVSFIANDALTKSIRKSTKWQKCDHGHCDYVGFTFGVISYCSHMMLLLMTVSLSGRVPGPNDHWQVRTTCRSVLVVQYLLWLYSVCIMDLK